MAETNEAGSVSKAALWGGSIGVVAPALVVAGVALAFLGAVRPLGGFVIMGLGLLCAVVGVVISAFGLRATRAASGRSGRGRALRGIVLSALTIAVVMAPALRAGNLPRINDITTDLDDPPLFVHAQDLEANRGRDMSYPGERFARQQLRAYPDLDHLIMRARPAEAFERIRGALAAMPGTRVTDADPATGRIEAVSTSGVFHFMDDVVVRVRPFDGGVKIDVRSKSRDGRGDLGVNAARIHALLARLRQPIR